MWLSILGLLAGLFILVKSADYLVEGASAIAKKFGVSPLFIGLTIVAFGSSMPELTVNLFAAASGSPEIAVGNVIGSNIANVLLGLGVAAMIKPLLIRRAAVWREVPFAILGALILFVLSADKWLGESADVLTRGEGFALIGFFFIFLYFTFKPVLERGGRTKKDKESVEVQTMSGWKAMVFILGGLIGLIAGGNLIVNTATFIALAIGISEALIALTVVAIGTSLPEIAATVIAARRGHSEMAVGNILGSVTFNTLWIMGLTAVVRPIPIFQGGIVDILLAATATFFIFPLMINKKKVGELTRTEGAFLFSLYIGYIIFTIWRG